MNWGVTSWSLSRVELRSREWESVEVSDFPEANPLQLEVLNVSSVSCPKTPRFCPREYLDNLPLRLYFVESYKLVCLFSENGFLSCSTLSPKSLLFFVFAVTTSYPPYFNDLSLKSARLKFTCKSSFFFWEVVFFQMNSEKGYTFLLKSSLGLFFSSFIIMQTVILD